MSAGVRTGGATARLFAQSAPAALALALIVAMFHDTAAAIVGTWYRSSTFNHAFLIIPICIYLAWQQRKEAMATAAAPTAWGIVAVVIASVAWLVGRVTGTLVIQEIALVCIAQGVLLAMYGWRICRIFAFPLLYLFFAVPMGEALVPPLQAQTADLAVSLLRVAGIPVFADGNMISIPTGNFQVAEECSGIRFLIASIALGTLFAGLTYRSWWRRASFVILSCVVPMLANGVRAFGIIFIAYVSSNELAVGIDHVVYGWVFFTAISFVTLAIGMAMREKGGPSSVDVPHSISIDHAWPAAGSLIAGTVAIAAALAVQSFSERIDRPNSLQSIRLVAPELGELWAKADGVADPMAPIFASPDAQLDASYVTSGAKLYLHIGYYLHERRGAEAVSYGHTLIHGKGWASSATGKRLTTLGDERISVQFVRAAAGRATRVIWYWYWVDGRFTGNPYVAKLLQAKAKLLGGAPAAAIIVTEIDADDGVDEAEDALAKFLSSLGGLARTLKGG